MLRKSEVESMSVKVLVARVNSDSANLKEAYYELGGLIGRIRRDNLWEFWEGKRYKFFGDWCWAVLGFRERKAESLDRIFTVLNSISIDAATLKRYVQLGWSKLNHIVRVLEAKSKDEDATEKVVEKWAKKGETLGARSLEAEVRLALGEDPSEEDGDNPDVDVVPSKKELPTITLTFDNKEDYRHVVKVMETIERRTKIENNGKIIGMMATAYLAQHVRDHEGGAAVELEYLIEAIERDYGVKLQVGKMGLKKPLVKADA